MRDTYKEIAIPVFISFLFAYFVVPINSVVHNIGKHYYV